MLKSLSDPYPRDIMNNKVFYQHPNLMRVLGMHETVMEVMVNVLGAEKSQVMLPELEPWAGTLEVTCLQLHGWCPSTPPLFPGRGRDVHSDRKEPGGGTVQLNGMQPM